MDAMGLALRLRHLGLSLGRVTPLGSVDLSRRETNAGMFLSGRDQGLGHGSAGGRIWDILGQGLSATCGEIADHACAELGFEILGKATGLVVGLEGDCALDGVDLGQGCEGAEDMVSIWPAI